MPCTQRFPVARTLFWLAALFPALASAQSSVQQQLLMVRELIPSVKTITVVCNVAEMQPQLKEIKANAASMGLQLSIFDVRAFPEVYKLFRSTAISSKTVDLIWMLPDSTVGNDKSSRRFVEENCIKKKIPLHVFSQEILHEGALMYMSVENQQPAYYVNKAAATLMEFKVPPGMESKVTIVE